MTDPQAALLAHLSAQPGLSGVTLIAGRNEPNVGYEPSQGPCIVFRVRGGTNSHDDDLLFPSMQIKCYAANELAAYTLYQNLRTALQYANNENVAWAAEEMIGQPLNEPDTGWPYVLAFFGLTIKNQ